MHSGNSCTLVRAMYGLRGTLCLALLSSDVAVTSSCLPAACLSRCPQMLAIGDGKERTRKEWEALLAAGGFRLTHVHHLRALPSLLEAHPA